MLRRITYLFCLLALTTTQAAVDFKRDVRPIFSDTCFKCHGPDAKARKAKLRLDTKNGVFGDWQVYRAVCPYFKRQYTARYAINRARG